jgi:hypothetical protein
VTLKIFWKLLERSVIARITLAVLATGALVYMICARGEAPGRLWLLVGASWYYFFGSGAVDDAKHILEKK